MIITQFVENVIKSYHKIIRNINANAGEDSIRQEGHNMNKKILALLTALLLVFCTACGSSQQTKEPQPQQNTEAPAGNTTENTEGEAEAQTGETAPTPEKSFEEQLNERLYLYADYLKEYCVPLLSTDSPDPRFDLLLLDDDELPELAIIEDNYHPIGVHIFMEVDGEVKEIGEFGSYGAAWYSPKQSILDNTYSGMGESDREIFSVDEKGNAVKLVSLGEIIDDNGDMGKYLIDGEEVDEIAYWAEVEKWYNETDNAIIYDYALSYRDFKEDLFGALSNRYQNPFDIYSDDFQPESYVPAIEDLVGEWTLFRYETEGDEGYVGDNGVVMSLTFYADGTVDYIENTYDEELSLHGLPLNTDEYGWLYFSYNSHDTDITNTLVAINGEELELSVSFENPDGTYGGSEWFFIRNY